MTFLTPEYESIPIKWLLSGSVLIQKRMAICMIILTSTPTFPSPQFFLPPRHPYLNQTSLYFQYGSTTRIYVKTGKLSFKK